MDKMKFYEYRSIADKVEAKFLEVLMTNIGWKIRSPKIIMFADSRMERFLHKYIGDTNTVVYSFTPRGILVDHGITITKI
jgi:hypothetical protein